MAEPDQPSLSVREAFARAIAAHQAGQLSEAERLYRAVLQVQPEHPDANHNLGVLAVNLGQPEAALPLLRTALQAGPRMIQYWLSYVHALIANGDLAEARAAIESAEKHGVPAERLVQTKKQLANRDTDGKGPTPKEEQQLVRLFDQGRFSDVEQIARIMTQRFPEHGFGWRVLGAALSQMGRNEDALVPAEKAAALVPELEEPQQNLAVILQRLGRLPEAVAGYRRALAINPTNAETYNKLGGVFHRLGQWAEAEASFRRATEIRPDFAEAHSNRSGVLKELGRLREAEASCQRALALKPNQPEPYVNLASIFKALGRLPDAEAACRRAIELKPDYAEAHNNLGGILLAQGNPKDAAASYERAAQIKPHFAEAHHNLGIVLYDLGKVEEAAACYRRAIAVRPNYAEAHSSLGMACESLGELAEAEGSCRRAIALKPNLVEAHINLGNTLLKQNRAPEAEAAYRRAVAIQPNHAGALNNLGGTVFGFDRLAEAESLFRRVIEVQPDYAEAYNNLSLTLIALGRPAEAITLSQRALEARPSYAAAHSNLLFGLNYLSRSATDVLAAHRRWENQHTDPTKKLRLSFTDKNPDRRLRIGYVSPDFREHSVAYFIEPLLREHDRSVCEVHCYSEVAQPDAVTVRLQERSDRWLRTVGLSDEALAQHIMDDRIDILVDLAGHTAHHRLGVFALKPAPIQITWLGYPNTTGLSTVDYRLVDEITDPTGVADAFATERLIRLENGFLCYAAPSTAPQPAPSPRVASGRVTFGSFNNPAKLSGATIEAWSRLMKRVSGARLVLKGKAFHEMAGRTAFLDRLLAEGVEPDRVTLRGKTAGTDEHLSLYSEVDVALDPFPYNGTTTTCEALWMGVPVVTLCGDRHAGRVGASLLTHAGLPELIADSIDSYIEIAANLAGDVERLKQYRRALRERMANSALCDARGFARQIEATYRRIWTDFCSRG